MKNVFTLGIYFVCFLQCFSFETETRFSKLENQLQDVTAELKELKQQCAARNDTCTRACSQSLQRDTRGTIPFVAFSATINADITPISNNEVIVFDHVISNEGGAYDPYIGRFQATVAGYYHFVVTVMSHASHYVEIELLQDGRLLCRARASSVYNAMGTCPVTIHMNLDSTVWVRHSGSSGDYIEGNYFPSFTGYLIKAD